MWWLIIIGIVIFIVYNINKDYKENVQSHIVNLGGMQKKYQTLVGYLTAHPSTGITKITNDSMVISGPTNTFHLDYVGQNLEISLKAFLPLLGNFSHKWKFQDGYPQEKMIEEIENFFDWKLKELQKMAESNPSQYINYKD